MIRSCCRSGSTTRTIIGGRSRRNVCAFALLKVDGWIRDHHSDRGGSHIPRSYRFEFLLDDPSTEDLKTDVVFV